MVGRPSAPDYFLDDGMVMVYWEGEGDIELWYAKELWLEEQLEVGIVKDEAQFSFIETIAAQVQEEKRKMGM